MKKPSKKTMIGIGILVALLVVCCGGGMLLASQTFRRLRTEINASRTFAREALEVTGKSWSETEFSRYAGEEFQKPENRKKTEKMFEVFDQKLGKLVSLGEFLPARPRGIETTNKGALIRFSIKAKFEKGDGEFVVGVLSRAQKRVIQEIKLNSKELFELSSGEKEAAKDRVKQDVETTLDKEKSKAKSKSN